MTYKMVRWGMDIYSAYGLGSAAMGLAILDVVSAGHITALVAGAALSGVITGYAVSRGHIGQMTALKGLMEEILKGNITARPERALTGHYHELAELINHQNSTVKQLLGRILLPPKKW